MTSRIYAIAQQKGGVGKTTTTINLGAALTARGRRVLLVDLDPQGALSAGMGINPENLPETIYDALRTPGYDLSQLVTRSDAGVDFIPANIDLSASELELVSEPGRERILKEKLSPLLNRYDYMLIDCPPSLGLLTLNALSAASRVVIPVQTQYFALRGMDLLLQTIEKVRQRLNGELEVLGILATMYNARTTHSREVLEEIRKQFGDKVFRTVTPYTVKLQDSSMAGGSILDFTPNSEVAQSYRDLAEEVESRE
jgi:chromosome partitioning protein